MIPRNSARTAEAWGQEFAKGVDQRAWKIFMEGTKEEKESFQEKVQEKWAGYYASDKHKPPEPTKNKYRSGNLTTRI